MSLEYHAIACFFDIDYTEFDYLEKLLQSYDVSKYAIGFEDKNSKGEHKPHFHFFFYGTEKIYINWSKVIIEKYKLRKSQKGGKIRYGKVKCIKKFDRMLSYTLKEGNFRVSGFSENELKTAIDQSFKKVTKLMICEEIVDMLDKLDTNYFRGINLGSEFNEFGDFINQKDTETKKIKYEIIKFCLQKDIHMSKAGLQSWYLYYLRKTSRLTIQEKIDKLYYQLN